MVRIISFNCQGLCDIAEHKDGFFKNYWRGLEYNIYFLQDTPFSSDTENEVRKGSSGFFLVHILQT